MATTGRIRANISNITFGIIQAKRKLCYQAGIRRDRNGVMVSNEKVSSFIILNMTRDMVVPIHYTCQITLFAQESNAEMDHPTNQILRRLEGPFEALHTIERTI